MRLRRSIVVERKPEEVFELVGSPERYPEFFSGVTKWQSRSDERRGPGALYRVLMKVGSIEAGGTIEVEEWDEPRRISWSSTQGLRQSGSWGLRPVDEGTQLALDIGYELSGGPAGWVVERIAGRIVGRNMLATLLAARRILEHEEPGA